MKKWIFAGVCLFNSLVAFSQAQQKKVFFIGNSYTYTNDLPSMISNMAASMGDKFTSESYTPGGERLSGHSVNPDVLNKIALGTWDYVVLQEQSVAPTGSPLVVESNVFRPAKILNNAIVAANPCTETVFYMTWGRKNGLGDCINYPRTCTYEAMDDVIRTNYEYMAEANDGIVSPVGVVWRYLREHHASIELYSPDESHPSVAGTYAAACCFYATMFRKDPTSSNYNASLSSADAAAIRAAVKTIVYDNLAEWRIGINDPQADFFYNTNNEEVIFTNISERAASYTWDFGDGQTSVLAHPKHSFKTGGTYTVKLIAEKCGYKNTMVKEVTTTTITNALFTIAENGWSLSPNPAEDFLTLKVVAQGEVHYSISHISGREIKSGMSFGNQSLIDISDLSEGLYIFRITDANSTTSVKKFLKK